MKKLFLLASVLLVFAAGCNKADESGELKTTAPINNNAPEAKNAPGAPSNPSIVYPGTIKGENKGGAPPAGK